MKNSILPVLKRHTLTVRPGRGLTKNQIVVLDLLDTMQIPPSTIDAEYARRTLRAASSVRRPLLAKISVDDATVRSLRRVSLEARNNVLDVITRIGSYTRDPGSISKNVFVVLNQMNVGRDFAGIDISTSFADELVEDLEKYLDLVDHQDGDDVSSVRNSATQISSIRFSLEGFGGSGKPVEDLVKLTPGLQVVRETKSLNNIARFDFTKRVPEILFTANYAPDGDALGSLVGWRKIADASGYVLSRRDFLNGREVSYDLTNAQLTAGTQDLSEYTSTWVLSFYDDIDLPSVYTFLDVDVDPNTYYLYTIQAYRNRRSQKDSIFLVDTAPSVGSPAQRAELRKKMELLDPGSGGDTISPYPMLAQHFLGDSRYDWVLAGINGRASLLRHESPTIIHGYSYLTAQLDFLLDQMDKKKFLIPKNIGNISENVNSAVIDFGVSQVIDEIFRDTGVLFHIDGKDPDGDRIFDRIEADQKGIVETVLAAADPETATIDLKILATNLPNLLSGKSAVARSILKGLSPATQIIVDGAGGNLVEGDIDSEVQFVHLHDPEIDVADLTTFDGISALIRTVRVFADFGSDRGTVSVTVKPREPKKPEKPPTKPPPTKPPTNPGSTRPKPSLPPVPTTPHGGGGGKSDDGSGRKLD